MRTPAQAESSIAACRAALGALDPQELGILLDWRLSPGYFDQSLQQAIVQAADAFAQQFARRAVLLLAPTQLKVTDRAVLPWSTAAMQLFHDEEAAIAHVTRV